MLRTNWQVAAFFGKTPKCIETCEIPWTQWIVDGLWTKRKLPSSHKHPVCLFACLLLLVWLFFFHCESLWCLQLCAVFISVWSDPSAAGLQWSSPIWAPWHSDYPLTCKHTATIWSCLPCCAPRRITTIPACLRPSLGFCPAYMFRLSLVTRFRRPSDEATPSGSYSRSPSLDSILILVSIQNLKPA